MSEAATRELPDEVVTFGGASKTYHRIGPNGDPACGQHGANPIQKDRTLIESHYDPCPKAQCFPRGATGES